jgi:hypothetical protein
MNSHQALQAEISGPLTFPIISTNREQALADFHQYYPSEELWRLVVDGTLYSTLPQRSDQIDVNGWAEYESREPGCIEAFFSAWQYCLYELKMQNSHTYMPLSKRFILELHEKVTEDVCNIPSHSKYQFRDGGEGFRFGNSMLYAYTREGIRDLLKVINHQFSGAGLFITHREMRIGSLFMPIEETCLSSQYTNDPIQQEILIDLIIENIKKSKITYAAPSSDHIKEIMDKTINDYNMNIVCANSDEEKLTLIAKTIQMFERIHPFERANGRVFVNLLLNYLLIQAGFPPATFFEPNIFDIYHDVVNAVKKAINNTLEIYGGKKDLFGFTTEQNNKTYKKMQAILIKSKARFHLGICDELNEIKLSELFQDKNFLFLHACFQLDKLNSKKNKKNIKEKIIELLMNQAIDSAVMQGYGHRIIYKIMYECEGDQDNKQDQKIIQLIINYPGFSATGNNYSRKDYELFLEVLCRGNFDFVRKLLLHVDQEYGFKNLKTLLFFPVLHNQIDIVKQLLTFPSVQPDAEIRIYVDYFLSQAKNAGVRDKIENCLKQNGKHRHSAVEITALELARMLELLEMTTTLNSKEEITANISRPTPQIVLRQ